MIGTADPIIEKMRAYSGAVDARRLTRAFEFGKRAHHGQMRASGEPYFTHPVAVANIMYSAHLASIGIDVGDTGGEHWWGANAQPSAQQRSSWASWA